jgi:hypothetical protein
VRPQTAVRCARSAGPGRRQAAQGEPAPAARPPSRSRCPQSRGPWCLPSQAINGAGLTVACLVAPQPQGLAKSARQTRDERQECHAHAPATAVAAGRRFNSMIDSHFLLPQLVTVSFAPRCWLRLCCARRLPLCKRGGSTVHWASARGTRLSQTVTFARALPSLLPRPATDGSGATQTLLRRYLRTTEWQSCARRATKSLSIPGSTLMGTRRACCRRRFPAASQPPAGAALGARRAGQGGRCCEAAHAAAAGAAAGAPGQAPDEAGAPRPGLDLLLREQGGGRTRRQGAG